jgi:cellulose synthase/poly-beta-1,6-N-acetylglucosamine synthase-like glycosyltransferase
MIVPFSSVSLCTRMHRAAWYIDENMYDNFYSPAELCLSTTWTPNILEAFWRSWSYQTVLVWSSTPSLPACIPFKPHKLSHLPFLLFLLIFLLLLYSCFFSTPVPPLLPYSFLPQILLYSCFFSTPAYSLLLILLFSCFLSTTASCLLLLLSTHYPSLLLPLLYSCFVSTLLHLVSCAF